MTLAERIRELSSRAGMKNEVVIWALMYVDLLGVDGVKTRQVVIDPAEINCVLMCVDDTAAGASKRFQYVTDGGVKMDANICDLQFYLGDGSRVVFQFDDDGPEWVRLPGLHTYPDVFIIGPPVLLD